jgi:hypothetical protein
VTCGTTTAVGVTHHCVMQDTALVALFTGSSTAIVAALGGAWPVLAENRRARHERQRILNEQEAERKAAHARRLRRGLTRTRSAVLLLAVTVRVCMDIRGSEHARLNEQDLVDALARARDCYFRANVTIESLRTLVGDNDQALSAIEKLLSAVAEAFSHVRSANSARVDPDQAEALIRRELREVSEAVRTASEK